MVVCWARFLKQLTNFLTPFLRKNVVKTGDVFMEKHWKSVIHRSICDYFFEAQAKAATPNDVPPVITTPHHYLINIYRNQLYVIAVVMTEVPPLFVIEFLHRVIDTFEDYFSECTESTIKDNYVIIYELLDEMLDDGYPAVMEPNVLREIIKPPSILRKLQDQILGESTSSWQHELHGSDEVVVAVVRHGVKPLENTWALLDEMLDNGFPLAVESNILKELIKPPNLLRSITDTVTGKSTSVSEVLPTGQLSNVPWRRMGVKYTNNEAYFDVIEEIDAIIDKSGSTVFAEIQGYIDCLVKLTGMPDLTLSFVNPRLLDDISFHPCVRFKRWESEKILSFVPPDGSFRLISYHIGAQYIAAIPVYIRHHISFRETGQGKLEITVGPKQTMGKPIENVILEIPFSKSVLNVMLTVNQGKYSFDPVTKVMTWDVGRIDSTKLPSIRGSIKLQSGCPAPDSNPIISVQFSISQLAASGLKVNRLDMYGEKYKPFKGVKYLTKAGKFQVRT